MLPLCGCGGWACVNFHEETVGEITNLAVALCLNTAGETIGSLR